MEIKLNSLILHNFKGIRDLTVKPDGENISIYGNNRVGKTTVFDAFSYLLFGKDSIGRKDFNIKTLVDGQALHNTEHYVEGVFSVDGSELILKKIYKEIYTKKRGTGNQEFSGHTTDHFLNEVPVSEKEYQRYLENLINESTFKMVSNPLYFNSMKWTEQRILLMNLCSQVASITDLEVIATNPNLSALIDILDGKSVEDFKKIVASKLSNINKEIDKIPTKIEEAKLAKPNIEGIDFLQIGAELKVADDTTEAFNKQLLELNYGGAVAQKNSDIANLRNSLSTMLVVPPCENQRASLQVLKTKRLDAELVGKSAERSRNDLSTRKANINNELVLLRLKHKEESLIEFIPKETCQLCGSPTPQMQIEELRATFNTTKSESLERISANGKTLNSRFAEASSDFEKAILDMKESDKTVIDLDIEIKGLEIKITDLTDISAVSLTPTYLAINKQIQDISSEIAEIKNGGENARNEILENINISKLYAEKLRTVCSKQDVFNIQTARVIELEVEQKRLAKQYELIQKQLFLTEQFIIAKVKMSDSIINNKFEIAKFKLFDVQVNGGISECCEVTVEGVPYSDLNSEARVNVGLDIIKTLCKHYDFYAPVFIDNAESVTELFEIDSQTICLVVSLEDKKVRMAISGTFEDCPMTELIAKKLEKEALTSAKAEIMEIKKEALKIEKGEK